MIGNIKIPGIYKEKKHLNPYNVFENEMENPDYNDDYRKILPDVEKADYKLPLKPEYHEAIGIRRHYNIAGAILLIFVLISNFLPFAAESFIKGLISGADEAQGANIISADYTEKLYEWISSGSSVEIAIVTLTHVIFNTILALIGLKLIRTKPIELIEDGEFSAGDIIRYAVISLSLVLIMSYIVTGIESLFSKNGMELVDVNSVTNANSKSIALDFIYVCLAAPITEELLFRGFTLKALSCVSQRFGIIVSALLFGLIHGNVAQFIVAFIVGIFLAHIDIKHNSIIPSICCHVLANTFSEISNYISTMNDESSGIVFFWNIVEIVFMGVGLVLLIAFLIKNRLPYNTPVQSMRSNAQILKSPALVITIVLEIAFIIYTNIVNNM